jgi:deoxyribonuclease V
MILAIDVHYRENEAKAVGVLFNWEDIQPLNIIVEYLLNINEYKPGEFYKRELPCLLKIIEKVNINEIEVIIIDGYIYTDSQGSFGLGGKLWEVLNKQIPIIGVAKLPFFSNKETVSEIFRGESKKPLYISTIDYPIDKAVENLKKMSGEYRLPTILKQMDTITKE